MYYESVVKVGVVSMEHMLTCSFVMLCNIEQEKKEKKSKDKKKEKKDKKKVRLCSVILLTFYYTHLSCSKYNTINISG